MYFSDILFITGIIFSLILGGTLIVKGVSDKNEQPVIEKQTTVEESSWSTLD